MADAGLVLSYGSEMCYVVCYISWGFSLYIFFSPWTVYWTVLACGFVYLFSVLLSMPQTWTLPMLFISLFLTFQYSLKIIIWFLCTVSEGALFWWEMMIKFSCITHFLHLFLQLWQFVCFFFSLISWPNLFMTAWVLVTVNVLLKSLISLAFWQ